MRASCAGVTKGHPVAWLVSEPAVQGPLPPSPGQFEEYALRAAVLAREVLRKWLAGDSGEVKDQLLFY